MRYVVCWYRGIMMYHRLCSMHITAVLLVLAPVDRRYSKKIKMVHSHAPKWSFGAHFAPRLGCTGAGAFAVSSQLTLVNAS